MNLADDLINVFKITDKIEKLIIERWRKVEEGEERARNSFVNLRM